MKIPFYRVIENIMEQSNVSIAKIAALCDIPDSTIRAAVKRKSESVALDIAFKLSQGLGIPLETINGEPSDTYKATSADDQSRTKNRPTTGEGDEPIDENDGLTEKQRELIAIYERLPDDKRKSLLDYAKFQESNQNG